MLVLVDRDWKPTPGQKFSVTSVGVIINHGGFKLQPQTPPTNRTLDDRRHMAATLEVERQVKKVRRRSDLLHPPTSVVYRRRNLEYISSLVRFSTPPTVDCTGVLLSHLNIDYLLTYCVRTLSCRPYLIWWRRSGGSPRHSHKLAERVPFLWFVSASLFGYIFIARNVNSNGRVLESGRVCLQELAVAVVFIENLTDYGVRRL